jgi:hypothetical protein
MAAAPAWSIEREVVKDNVSRLRDLGHHVIEPVTGYEVAGMKLVSGAMPPIEEVCIQLLEIQRRHRSGPSTSGMTQGQA